MAVSLSFIVGLIGNFISILVFASPIKTFCRVVKKKSTENFKGIPYVTTLLSTSLWTFYGLLKPDGILIVTVNAAGATLQVIYVTLFLIYAPKDKKIKTGKLVAILDVGFLGFVIAVTLLAVREDIKLTFVGLLCAAFTIGMYAAPLSIMGMVIKMKSVEYMPFWLSFFLLLNGGVWSIYAVLVKDFFIGVPNAIGFILGSGQLVIYLMYRNKTPRSTATKEEESSDTLVEERGVEMQMQEYGEDEENNLNNRILEKGHSLPRPFMTRLNSMPQKIVKALSLNANELQSSWAFADDLENAEKNRY
ncbi:hypothetical protein UlMin_029159 [Ulmus minor]